MSDAVSPTKEERMKAADTLGNFPKAEWTAIFIIIRNESTNEEGSDYTKKLLRLLEVVPTIPGFLGVDVTSTGTKDVVATYWDSLEAIGKWRRHPEHLSAQKSGRSGWFDAYRVIIAEIKKEYGFILPELLPEGGKVPTSSQEAAGPKY